MKNTKNIYIILCVIIAVIVSGGIFLSLNKSEKGEDSISVAEILLKDEELLMNGLEKAPEAEDLVFLLEGTDCSFVAGDKALVKAAKDILSDVFDGVVFKSKALSSKKTTKLSDSEKSKLKDLTDYVIAKGKTAYIYCTAMLSAESVIESANIANGVIIDISFVTDADVSTLSKKLVSIKNKLKDKQIILYIQRETKIIYSLDKASFDGIFVSLEGQADAERFRKLYTDFSSDGIQVCPLTDYSLYGEGGLNADKPLRALYEIKECIADSKRGFTYYSAIKNNRDNCYGAVRAYITSGIVPEMAFRGVTVLSDNGEEVKVSEPLAKVHLSASNLFPVYAGKKRIGIFPKGSHEVSLELLRGKNSFTFTQNGSQASFEVEYVFEGDIIKSVAPDDTIHVAPGDEMVVMVVAYSEAKVFVKLGSTEYEAKKKEDAKGFTAFYAEIKIPSELETIAAMGKIKVTATLGEQTQTVDGADIVPVEIESVPTTILPQPVQSVSEEENQAETQIESQTEALAETTVTYPMDNYAPTYIQGDYQVISLISDAISKATTNGLATPYTGNQMAVITADYADVKPGNSDSDYIPYYTYLAKGTMDFVIGESRVADSDDGTTNHYYDLASGLRVNSDSAVLQAATTMPENVFNVSSVYGGDGELTIRLKNTWKVPYYFTLENQQYYSGNSESFNVSDFTATAISLTFHYTTGAYGDIDCSASDVVSSATWTVSQENKTATLYLPLRQQGAYYGYSLTYEGDETVITIKGKPKSVAGSVVVLDPGHGADDPGALGLSGAVKESDINILVAYQVKNALQQQGVTVYMTRYGDDDINLEGRKIFARSVKPDLFVSIHSNASDSTSSIGTSTYYYKPFSVNLATDIYNELVGVFRNNLYAGQQDIYNDIARGVMYYPFSVTRLEECPSTLVELGFITNDAECYMLTKEENQALLGQAIARGICKSLTR